MALPKRPLGSTGFDITTVGFGSWAVGGGGWSFGWGPQDDEASIEAIRHAVDLGIGWVDTAAIYGHGHGEEVVGRAVRALPAASRPLVFTKCGLAWDDADPMKPATRVVTAETVRRGAEDSLRRLGLGQVDLFQIHWPDAESRPIEPAWREMLKLRDEGLTRAIGVSNFGPDLLARCEALGHVDTLQPPFSMIERETAGDLLPWAEARGTGVICYSPMRNGILTDSFSAARVAAMADDDWRAKARAFREPDLSRNLALRDSLRPIAERHEATVAAVAVAWVLAWPAVSGAIVGARAPEQVDGWVGAASLTLSDDDRADIAAAIVASGAGEGPTDPRRV